jgi:hypothetical protein
VARALEWVLLDRQRSPPGAHHNDLPLSQLSTRSCRGQLVIGPPNHWSLGAWIPMGSHRDRLVPDHGGGRRSHRLGPQGVKGGDRPVLAASVAQERSRGVDYTAQRSPVYSSRSPRGPLVKPRHEFVYISAELRRPCRIAVSPWISMFALSRVEGFIRP